MLLENNKIEKNALLERFGSIQKRIKSALERSSSGPRPILLLGVSKGQPLSLIRQMAQLGVTHLGENYTQELLSKAPLCADLNISWHFIGRLQSNKIKHILPYVHLIQSLDSLELAERIERTAEKEKVPVLLQVNLGNEQQKAGLAPPVVKELFPEFLKKSGIVIKGLMTIPPQTKDSFTTRAFFREMKQLYDQLLQIHTHPEVFTNLSMGMSQDFEIALEEGATCVRIGEALFGPRSH